MNEGKEKQFEVFFANKMNVNMSSYQVYPKTNIPILYLKDQKSELWKKFSQKYSNSMKKTLFMAKLANRSFRYRENLDSLYLIYNTYDYQIFEDLQTLVKSDIINKNIQVKFIIIIIFFSIFSNYLYIFVE